MYYSVDQMLIKTIAKAMNITNDLRSLARSITCDPGSKRAGKSLPESQAQMMTIRSQLGKQLVPVERYSKRTRGRLESHTESFSKSQAPKVSLRKTEAFPAATNPGRYLRPPRRKANQHQQPRKTMEDSRTPKGSCILAQICPHTIRTISPCESLQGQGFDEATYKV